MWFCNQKQNKLHFYFVNVQVGPLSIRQYKPILIPTTLLTELITFNVCIKWDMGNLWTFNIRYISQLKLKSKDA